MKVALVNRTMRFLVSNMEDKWVDGGVIVPDKHSVVGSGDHGTAINVSTGFLVQIWICITRLVVGMSTISVSKCVYVKRALVKVKEGSKPVQSSRVITSGVARSVWADRV